jgi:N6-L-threonylcarbamoyladenine synthase
MHVKTGGVIPEKAAREQLKVMIPTLQECLKIASSQASRNDAWVRENIDAIAVTYGPGLIGSLLVGVETAKTLAYLWNKPLIPVNHLVAHVYANWLVEEEIASSQAPRNDNHKAPEFPVIALVVSGAHTDLVHMQSHGEIKKLGSTRDDAAGEAFDKTARLLGLPYPGGVRLAGMADRAVHAGRDRRAGELNLFPRPMINSSDYDFSFSGLKTAVVNYLKTSDELRDSSTDARNDKALVAAEIQEAIVDVLIEKSVRAITEYSPASFLLSGGVAANSRLKQKFEARFKKENFKTKFFAPLPRYCTDNGVVIASAAYFNNNPVDWRDIVVDPELRIDS